MNNSDVYVKNLEERTRLAEDKYYLEYEMRQLSESRFDLLIERINKIAENIKQNAELVLDEIYGDTISKVAVRDVEYSAKTIVELADGLIEDTRKVINNEILEKCQKKKHT